VQEFEKKRRETVAKMQEKTNLSSQLHKEQQEEKKLNKLESSLKTESSTSPRYFQHLHVIQTRLQRSRVTIHSMETRVEHIDPLIP
jgi:hypothetical protein